MKRLIFAGVVLASVGLSRAQEPAAKPPTPPATTTAPEAPRTPAARDALARYDRAAAQAESDYRAAVAKARHELIDALEVAKKAAMKNGSLEEAIRIDATIKANPDERKAGPSLSEQIAAQRYFNYSWNTGGRVVELLPNGTIGQGANPAEKRWKASDQGVILYGEAGQAELIQCVDGSFRGANKSGTAVSLVAK